MAGFYREIVPSFWVPAADGSWPARFFLPPAGEKLSHMSGRVLLPVAGLGLQKLPAKGVVALSISIRL